MHALLFSFEENDHRAVPQQGLHQRLRSSYESSCASPWQRKSIQTRRRDLRRELGPRRHSYTMGNCSFSTSRDNRRLAATSLEDSQAPFPSMGSRSTRDFRRGHLRAVAKPVLATRTYSCGLRGPTHFLLHSASPWQRCSVWQAGRHDAVAERAPPDLRVAM